MTGLWRNVSGELEAAEASWERNGSLGLNGGMGILDLFWAFMAQRVVLKFLKLPFVLLLLRDCDEEVEAEGSEDAMGKCRGVVAMVFVCVFFFFLGLIFLFFVWWKSEKLYGFFFFPVLRSRKKWSGGEDCGWWVGLWMVRMGQSNRYIKNILYKMISNFIYQNSISVKISTNKYVFY